MFELITYCILGLCLFIDFILVITLMLESAQDLAKLEELFKQHAKKEW